MMNIERKQKNEPDRGDGRDVQRPRWKRRHNTAGERNGVAPMSAGQHAVTDKGHKGRNQRGKQGTCSSHVDEFGH